MHGQWTRELEQRSAAKRAAALSSLMAALAITLLKLLTGVLTGSLGMLSEAAHSAVDLIASAITLITVRVSDRPADEDHNYGHGKLESLSAGIETLIMAASCFWIAREAILRILHRSHLDLRWSIWPFVVLLLSMAVDYTRSRSLHRVAQEQRSDALEADAMHFGTDLWSAAAVFVGLLASFAGQRFNLPALEYADPIAALVVSGVIVSVTWRLARTTIDSLLDATPSEARAQIRRDLVNDLEAVDGVLTVERVRVRRSGSDYFVDLTLGMPRNLTFQRSEQITFAATAAVQKRLPGADVVIHSVPTATVGESVFDRIRASPPAPTSISTTSASSSTKAPTTSNSISKSPRPCRCRRPTTSPRSSNPKSAAKSRPSPQSSPTSKANPPPSPTPPSSRPTKISTDSSSKLPPNFPRFRTSTKSPSLVATAVQPIASRSTATSRCPTIFLCPASTKSSLSSKTPSASATPR